MFCNMNLPCSTVQVLDFLERLCVLEKVGTLRLDGSTQVDKRLDLVNRFNKDETVRVMLLSAQAGGVGLNLIGANRLVLFGMLHLLYACLQSLTAQC